MTGTSGSIQFVPSDGTARMVNQFSITGASRVWQDTGVTIDLPTAGRYLVSAETRSGLALQPSQSPAAFISTRLFNVTAGTPVNGSQRIGAYLGALGDDATNASANATTVISEFITVTGPTTIGLQAMRAFDTGDGSNIQTSLIGTGPDGQTKLSYLKVGLA